MKRISIFDKIFVHYVNVMNGSFLLVCQDDYFSKTVRACFKALALKDNCLYSFRTFVNLFKQLENILSAHSRAILLIERHIEGRSTLDDFSALHEKFKSKLKIITIFSEIDQQTLALYLEKGSNNVMVKPISMNTIIQKISSTISPNNALDELIEKCKALMSRNNLEKASDVCDQILKEKPDSSIGLMLKGDIHLRRNDLKKSHEYYIQAHNASKLYLEPLKRLVHLYESTSDINSKLIYLTKLDRLSPLNRDRKIQLANSYVEIGDTKNAYKYTEEAIEISKKEANEILSKTYMDAGNVLKQIDPDKSSQYFDKAIERKGRQLAKSDVWMFNEKGINLRRQKKTVEAFECFKSALRLSPNDPIINYNLGLAYADLKEFALASKCFDSVISNDETIVNTNSSVAFNIGVTYFNASRFDQAYSMLEIALKLEPANENINAMKNTAYKKTSIFEKTNILL